MKTKYKYIHFNETVKGTWYCYNNKTESDLGCVEYYKRWKQWVWVWGRIGEFEQDRVFNGQCLEDIIDFLGQLNKGEIEK